MIKNTQVSMLAKGEPREAFLPDFNKPEMLKEMGFTQGADGKWYHSNRDWYPNALSNKDVVYVFKRDASGKPIDTGFGPSAELNTLYVRSEDFDANNMKFVNPSTMKPGEIISVKKCASGSFCILPVGTKLFTSEGIVEVLKNEAELDNDFKMIKNIAGKGVKGSYDEEIYIGNSKLLEEFGPKFSEENQRYFNEKSENGSLLIFSSFGSFRGSSSFFSSSFGLLSSGFESIGGLFIFSSGFGCLFSFEGMST